MEEREVDLAETVKSQLPAGCIARIMVAKGEGRVHMETVCHKLLNEFDGQVCAEGRFQ